MPCGLQMCRSNPGIREYNSLQVSCSSFKPKYDAAQLLDNNKDTYWQSNCMGRQAKNAINIQLAKVLQPEYVVVCVNYAIDRSFTPERISVHVGYDESDAQQVGMLHFNKNVGWIAYKLPSFEYKFIQLRVEANHLYGQDSRVRGIKLFRRCNGDNLGHQYRL